MAGLGELGKTSSFASDSPLFQPLGAGKGRGVPDPIFLLSFAEGLKAASLIIFTR